MKKTRASPTDNLSFFGGAVPPHDPAGTAADDRNLVILSTPADETVQDVHTDRLVDHSEEFMRPNQVVEV